MRRAGRATLLASAGATGCEYETAVVRYEGIGVLGGLSLVTNMAIGVGQGMRARPGTPRSVGEELNA